MILRRLGSDDDDDDDVMVAGDDNEELLPTGVVHDDGNILSDFKRDD